MKSPLRYPGGKTRAVKHILPHIPDHAEYCAPFLGGGSVELALAERGSVVYGYDIFKPLVWFWKALLESPSKLADISDSYRAPDVYLYKGEEQCERGLSRELFKAFREQIKQELDKDSPSFSFDLAAKFYAINRSSFSGATFSGGFSKRASYARFTDSSIDRIRNFKQDNLFVECADFEESILKHPNAFLYLDPPYMLSKKQQENLYGVQGNTHSDFDHGRLFSLLKDRKNWVMSYGGDADQIFEMYNSFKIIDLSGKWAYGMKNVSSESKKMGKSSEILIIGGKND
tara:strand:- start:949 stop:1809 length:861 start_codon:yes stop_codon:yes gene_type:complete